MKIRKFVIEWTLPATLQYSNILLKFPPKESMIMAHVLRHGFLMLVVLLPPVFQGFVFPADGLSGNTGSVDMSRKRQV